MVADLLTKAVARALFASLMDLIRQYAPAENAGTSLFGQSDTEPEEDANTPTAE